MWKIGHLMQDFFKLFQIPKSPWVVVNTSGKKSAGRMVRTSANKFNKTLRFWKQIQLNSSFLQTNSIKLFTPANKFNKNFSFLKQIQLNSSTCRMYVSWLFVEKLCLSDYFSYVEYQDLCATINQIKDLEVQKQSLKHLCNINSLFSRSRQLGGPTKV